MGCLAMTTSCCVSAWPLKLCLSRCRLPRSETVEARFRSSPAAFLEQGVRGLASAGASRATSPAFAIRGCAGRARAGRHLEHDDAPDSHAAAGHAYIPIVFAMVLDPVGADIVESLPEPGGNTTGLAGAPQAGRPRREREAVFVIRQLVRHRLVRSSMPCGYLRAGSDASSPAGGTTEADWSESRVNCLEAANI